MILKRPWVSRPEGVSAVPESINGITDHLGILWDQRSRAMLLKLKRLVEAPPSGLEPVNLR